MENPTRESLLLLSVECPRQRFRVLPPKHGGAWCHAATAVPTTAPLLAARGLGPVPRLCIRPARQPVHPASGGACTGGGRGRLRRLCRSRRGAVQDLGGRRRAPPQPPTECDCSLSLQPATAATQCALSDGAARHECVLAQPGACRARVRLVQDLGGRRHSQCDGAARVQLGACMASVRRTG